MNSDRRWVDQALYRRRPSIANVVRTGRLGEFSRQIGEERQSADKEETAIDVGTV
jgi:hypothetical protein